LLIPVTVAGHRFWCSPDTGYSALVTLDPDKATAAGLLGAPGNGASPRDARISADLIVGGVTFPNQAISLRRFAENADQEMDCIFGVALLHQFVVEFDYVRPALTLYDPSGFQPSPGTERVPLIFYTNPRVPFVDISMTFGAGPPESLRVVPDTGTSFYSGLVVGGAVERVSSRAQKTAVAITYPDPEPGRILQVVAARPTAVTVGPFSIKAPVIAFISGNVGNGGIADGTLGEGFFKRFTVAFDFDGHAMYLRPNSRLGESSPFDASGIGFVRRDGRHVVFTVLADSPGSKAGVQIGDVLTEVDGKQAATLTSVEVRNLFSVRARARRVVLERNGHRVNLRLDLTPRI
jgi:hypothetical protein